MQLDRPADGDSDPPENTLQRLFPKGFEMELPHALQIIDAEQRGILRAIAASTAPAHVIHALAGCGNSILLQCLVFLCDVCG